MPLSTDLRDKLGEHPFQSLMSSWSLPVMILDREMLFVFANEAYLASVERLWSDLEGVYIFDAFPDTEERVQTVKAIFERSLAGVMTTLDAQPYHLDLANGEVETRYWQTVQEPIRDRSGDVQFMVQRAEDVTERTLLLKQNEIISAELDHRVKNLMTIIQSVARLTERSAVSTESYIEDFCARIDSMGRTYDRLSENKWRGLRFRELIEEELSTLLGQASDRYTIEGPDITLSLKSTKDAGLMIHELATNAVKYGCFTRPDGHLTVKWFVEETYLRVEWIETGLVNLQPPDRKGFGTKLFLSMPNVKYEIQYLPTGVHVIIQTPREITEAAAEKEFFASRGGRG